MKKSLLFLASGALLMTSCSDDNTTMQAPDGGGNVNFTVAMPANGYGSRVFADGYTATDLVYAVYDASNDALVSQGDATFDANSHETTVSLQLANGKGYKIAFFAHKNDHGVYTFDAENKEVSVDYTKMADYNATDYDAFYAVKEIVKVTGPINETVTLTRPLAQVNWGTNDLANEFVTAPDAYDKDTDNKAKNLVSKVEISGVYSAFDLLTGEVKGEAATVTFDEKARPVGETFPVANYEYMSMNYILVPSAQSSLVEAILTPSNGTTASEAVKVANMPVQANYRTNVYGSLLTVPGEFQIVKDPSWAGPDFNVSNVWEGDATEQDLADLIAAGGVVIVGKDVAEIDLTDYAAQKPLMLVLAAEVGKIYVKDFAEDQPLTVKVGKDVAFPAFGNKTTTGPAGGTSLAKNITIEGDLSSSVKSGRIPLYSMGSGSENVTIKNINFDGALIDADDNRNLSGIIDDRYGAKNLVVDNCTFVNMKYPAVYITKNIDNGTPVPHESVTVTNCTITMADDAETNTNGLYLLNINNVTVKGCKINNAPYHGIFTRAFVSAAITDNVINGVGQDGIKVECDWSSYNVTSENIVITNNSLSQGMNGIRVKAYKSFAKNATITGNTIDMTNAAEFDEKEGEPCGILLVAKDATVEPNLIVSDNIKKGTGADLHWFSLQGFTPAEGSNYSAPYTE